ncbi:hypothetical protein [Microcystis phage Mel-JY33]
MTTLININGDVRDAASLTVPTDRTFRGAWRFNGPAVEVDMDAARAIHRQNLRAERAPRLAALDVQVMRAIEEGRGTATLVGEKQRLRDVTADPRIDAAKSPEELKALTLDNLLAAK